MSGPAGSGEPIELPERFDRPSRVGPFPSGTDTVKFLVLCAVGAVVALRFGPIYWTPFVGLGLLVALHRPEQPALDERLADYLRWRWRRANPTPRPPAGGASSSLSVVRLPDGRLAAAVIAGGIPLAFRPAEDAARVFDGYRALLRELDGTLLLTVGRKPISAAPFLPSGRPPSGAGERTARQGYSELLRLLLRRRAGRQVGFWLVAPHEGAGAHPALEARLRAVGDYLDSVEVPHERLRGAALRRGERDLLLGGWR